MSESDVLEYLGIERFSDEYWEDFGDIVPELDVIENSFDPDHYPHQSPAFTLGDLAEQQDIYERIHSPSFLSQQQQNHQRQTIMPNLRNASPPFPFEFSTSNPFDTNSDSEPDPFRPLSSNSNCPYSRASTVIDLTDSPPLQMAKRKLTGAAATAHEAKKRRLSGVQDSLSTSRQSTDPPKTKVETVDLTNMEKYEAFARREKREREALAAQKLKDEAAKLKKLAEFECVICLDNPADLVITHCGHLFCSACIHHALDSGPGGSRCPSCRARIITKNLPNGKENKMCYYPLEIKLKRSTKGGKRKA